MDHKEDFNRREFLKFLAITGGMIVASPYLKACSQTSQEREIAPTTESTQTLTQQNFAREEVEPTSSLEPEDTHTPEVQETPRVETARIAFVKTRDRDAGVHKAINLLGENTLSGKNIFLKPNFNSADPTPGSTHPDILAALVRKLKQMGANSILVGDRSGMGDTRAVMQAIGVFKMADELGFNTVVFDELGTEDWVMMHPPNSHWEQGFPVARPTLEADALVQTCCLKTHQYGGHFTMSLKNSVGMVGKRIPGNAHNFMNELHTSPHQRLMIAEINTAYTPALILLDGVEAFISEGPARGELANSKVVLAGTDRIAIDAVGVALLRYHGCKTKVAAGPIFEQEQIARAVELGLGIDCPQKIELITDDPESAAYAEQIKSILLQ